MKGERKFQTTTCSAATDGRRGGVTVMVIEWRNAQGWGRKEEGMKETAGVGGGGSGVLTRGERGFIIFFVFRLMPVFFYKRRVSLLAAEISPRTKSREYHHAI